MKQQAIPTKRTKVTSILEEDLTLGVLPTTLNVSEAQEGFAELNEVDEGTIVRCIQWGYNGEYEPGDKTFDELHQ